MVGIVCCPIFTTSEPCLLYVEPYIEVNIQGLNFCILPLPPGALYTTIYSPEDSPSSINTRTLVLVCPTFRSGGIRVLCIFLLGYGLTNYNENIAVQKSYEFSISIE